MRLNSLNVFVLFLTLVFSSLSFSAVQPRIVGGTVVTDENKYPWMAQVFAETRRDGGTIYGRFCGGTLIAQSWILTAAHCLYDEDQERFVNDQFIISVGELDSTGNIADREVVRSVVASYEHPEYDADTISNDIALLKLSRPIESLTPIKLNSGFLNDDDMSGTDALGVIGWGVTSALTADEIELEDATVVSDLREVNVDLFGRAYCRALIGGLPSNESFICAGKEEGGKDSCQGDSGGPLFSDYQGSNVQVGIVSFGFGCAQPNSPGVYTNVSFYNSWISSTTTSGGSRGIDDNQLSPSHGSGGGGAMRLTDLAALLVLLMMMSVLRDFKAREN